MTLKLGTVYGITLPYKLAQIVYYILIASICVFSSATALGMAVFVYRYICNA